MNSTFMFGEDRLGPDEDFAATYHALGGRALTRESLHAAVIACVERMSCMYDDAAFANDFPGVLEVLRALPEAATFSDIELGLVSSVIARHEIGRISAPFAAAVLRIARTHRLGLVANIWSPKDLWLDELARAGLGDVFAARVFSSDSRSMKPSRAIFAEALGGCGVNGSGPHADVVCIGDSLRCDVGGAQAAGLRTIWINPSGRAPSSTGPRPDAWVHDLLELVSPEQPDGRAL